MSEVQDVKSSNKGVLVLYTGGTIGSAPRDPEDPDSPQKVVPWEDLRSATPELGKLEERGCRVECHPFHPPLDSCNVGPEEWAAMAQVIDDRYNEFEGFVILHGTDTMVYSASALSFMLLDLAKPVVFTGAQRSALVDFRNDATQNFITAILIANPRFSGVPVVPEVTLYFGGYLLRGNRSVKNDTSDYAAYLSPNLEPLGEAGDRITINDKLVRPRPHRDRKFHIRTRLNTHVMPLFIYPGIPTELVERQLSLPALRAVVIQSFGSGNIPTRPDLLEVFRKARDKNIVLANVSQCLKGPVELGIYETSAALLEAGFISADDITVEAAQCKLMTLLGDPDIEPDEVEQEFQVSLAGEQGTSMFVTRLSNVTQKIEMSDDATEPGRLRLPGKPLAGLPDPSRLDRALLRLRHAKVGLCRDDTVEFRLFINLDVEQNLGGANPDLVETYAKWRMEEDGLVVFDVSRLVRAVAAPRERVSFTFAVDTPGGSLSWNQAELALMVLETRP